VTKDVGQIRDVTIYGRSSSEDIRDAVMREPHTLQIINFSSFRLNKGVFSLGLYLLKYLFSSLIK